MSVHDPLLTLKQQVSIHRSQTVSLVSYILKQGWVRVIFRVLPLIQPNG